MNNNHLFYDIIQSFIDQRSIKYVFGVNYGKIVLFDC